MGEQKPKSSVHSYDEGAFRFRGSAREPRRARGARLSREPLAQNHRQAPVLTGTIMSRGAPGGTEARPATTSTRRFSPPGQCAPGHARHTAAPGEL